MSLGLYSRAVLEGLRGPLEDGVVWITRSGGAICYPCRFSLVAAMNPCPCGFLDDADKPCRCGYVQLTNYASKLSGPLLDRFDMQVTMDRVGKDELLGAPDGDSSEAVRARVQACREIQSQRYGSALHTNATVSRPVLNAKLGLTASARLARGAARPDFWREVVRRFSEPVSRKADCRICRKYATNYQPKQVRRWRMGIERRTFLKASLLGAMGGAVSQTAAGASPAQGPDTFFGSIADVKLPRHLELQTDEGSFAVVIRDDASLWRDEYCSLERFVVGDEVVVQGALRDGFVDASGLAAVLKLVETTIESREKSRLHTTAGNVVLTDRTLARAGPNAKAKPLNELRRGDQVRVTGRLDPHTNEMFAVDIGVIEEG